MSLTSVTFAASDLGKRSFLELFEGFSVDKRFSDVTDTDHQMLIIAHFCSHTEQLTAERRFRRQLAVKVELVVEDL